MNITELEYKPSETIARFHESNAMCRAIVGPAGSGKSSAACMEIGEYLPEHLKEKYGVTNTRWLVLRNTNRELNDSTMKTFFEWFPEAHANYRVQRQEAKFKHSDGRQVEVLFRSCDRPDQVKSIKGMELTGAWVDESIEVGEDTKKMIKNRIGRYPRRLPKGIKFLIETTNPPDVEHPMYLQYRWNSPPPGPIPKGEPLEFHLGFWQKERENEENLPFGYYDDLIAMYRDDPDWIARYVKGEPGITIIGKLVYNNFKRSIHIAGAPLKWSGGQLYAGWDHSGNVPACVICQCPTAMQVQILAEFWTERMNIGDFADMVIQARNMRFPGATYIEYGDPAGWNTFSLKSGGFTSNTDILKDHGIILLKSEQDLATRIDAVESQLGKFVGGEPALLIDPGCTRTINGMMGGYCYKKLGEGIYSKEPIKNIFSHCAEAAQYLLLKLVKNIRSPYKLPIRKKLNWMVA